MRKKLVAPVLSHTHDQHSKCFLRPSPLPLVVLKVGQLRLPPVWGWLWPTVIAGLRIQRRELHDALVQTSRTY